MLVVDAFFSRGGAKLMGDTTDAYKSTFSPRYVIFMFHPISQPMIDGIGFPFDVVNFCSITKDDIRMTESLETD